MLTKSVHKFSVDFTVLICSEWKAPNVPQADTDLQQFVWHDSMITTVKANIYRDAAHQELEAVAPHRSTRSMIVAAFNLAKSKEKMSSTHNCDKKFCLDTSRLSYQSAYQRYKLSLLPTSQLRFMT